MLKIYIQAESLKADDAEILRTDDVQAGRPGPAWTS